MKQEHWTPGACPFPIKACGCPPQSAAQTPTELHTYLSDVFKSYIFSFCDKWLNNWSHDLFLCFPGMAGDLLCQKEEWRQHSAKCEDHTCNWAGRVSGCFGNLAPVVGFNVNDLFSNRMITL